MALYDSPVANDFKVLTHTSSRRFQKNGFQQVGNTIFPTNELSKNRVAPSAIYSKGIKKFGVAGISEAGYGRRYPNPKGLSYGGAGSYGAAGSKLGYSGAGSYGAAGSKLGYSGAGSYGAAGSKLGYSGAGSHGAAGSSLSDAYINDNPSPAELARLNLGGLAAEDTSIWGTITGAISNLTTTAVKEGQTALNKSITTTLNPPPQPPKPIVTTAMPSLPVSTGLSMDKLLFGGAILLGGYFLIRKLA